MKKFKEIIFLKNLRRVGKKTIYDKYWDLLNDSDDFFDLVSEVEVNSNFTKEEITKAMNGAEELYDYLITSDIDVITVFDDDYPEKLNVMGDKRPLILYVKGNSDALAKPNIAVIGTRKPSKMSEEFEENLIKSIVNETDKVVVSGLALGCDRIAHQTTVDENKRTIAVLPSGVNVITPATNKKLAQRIIETGGCLVSEYDINAKAFKSTYVERDKIVAAFSDATFVVECGIKSGTMHTVDAAVEYQRQIFSYLPTQKSPKSYDGNEFILENNKDAIQVEDIQEFLKCLKKGAPKNEINSAQSSLDNFK